MIFCHVLVLVIVSWQRKWCCECGAVLSAVVGAFSTWPRHRQLHEDLLSHESYVRVGLGSVEPYKPNTVGLNWVWGIRIFKAQVNKQICKPCLQWSSMHRIGANARAFHQPPCCLLPGSTGCPALHQACWTVFSSYDLKPNGKWIFLILIEQGKSLF